VTPPLSVLGTVFIISDFLPACTILVCKMKAPEIKTGKRRKGESGKEREGKGEEREEKGRKGREGT
jgi:hypothetical protein